MIVVDPVGIFARPGCFNPLKIGACVVTASIFDSYPSPAGVCFHLFTRDCARAGGFFSHRTKVLCGSHADTTTFAVTVAPSPVCTALTELPSHTIPTTRVSVRNMPPYSRKACFKLSGKAPLPPFGRPRFATCRNAKAIAPSPVPGVSGDKPHTTGPSTIAGPIIDSSVKN